METTALSTSVVHAAKIIGLIWECAAGIVVVAAMFAFIMSLTRRVK